VLYNWFPPKRSEGITVSGTLLIEKAKYLYNEMAPNEPYAFSDGLLSCFKLGHGIRLDVSGEKKSVVHEAAEKY